MNLSGLLADIAGTTIDGEDRPVSSFARPGHGDADKGRFELWFDGPVESDAPVIADDKLEIERASNTLARVPNLRENLARILAPFVRPYPHGRDQEDQSHDFLDQRVDLDLGPNIVVPRGVELGSGCRLGPGVSLHPETRLGKQVELRAGVRIECPAIIEDNTTIHANTTIGADGFGYEQIDGKHRKVPQVGGVWIGEEVEIGSLTSVDRATYGYTRIGSGTKIDNQVQVGHNCQIGEHCILVGRVDLAGSAEIGDYVTIAGEAAVRDHVTIADRVTIAARAGVTKDITEEGITVSGFPAQPHQQELRQRARIRRLDDLKQRLQSLEETVQSRSEEDALT